MSSKIDIINLALGRISQSPIGDLNEGSIQATIAQRIFDPCVSECLSGNDWSFAQVREALAEVANYTPVGWSYAYTYPANCLRLWRISNDFTAKRTGDRFARAYVPALNQSVILTNTGLAVAEYTFFVKDTTIYTPDFVSVLAYRLAADFAMPLNADMEQAINMSKIFQSEMSEAKRMSSYEDDALYVRDESAYVDARGSGSPTVRQALGGPGGVNFVDWNNQT
jgi:hypothetical protein